MDRIKKLPNGTPPMGIIEKVNEVIELINGESPAQLKKFDYDGLGSLTALILGHKLSLYQRMDARQELDNLKQTIEDLKERNLELEEKNESLKSLLPPGFEEDKFNIYPKV